MTAGLSRACAGVWGHRDPGPPCRRDSLAARAGGWGGWRLGGCMCADSRPGRLRAGPEKRKGGPQRLGLGGWQLLGSRTYPEGRGLVSELGELRKAMNFWVRGETHGGGGEARLYGGGGCRPGGKRRGGQGLGRSPETLRAGELGTDRRGAAHPQTTAVCNFKLPPGPRDSVGQPEGVGPGKPPQGSYFEGKTIFIWKVGVGFPGGSGGKKSEMWVFNPWKTPWRREWFPSPVFFPGESHGQRSLVGYSPEVTGLDTTEQLTLSLHAVFRFFFNCPGLNEENPQNQSEAYGITVETWLPLLPELGELSRHSLVEAQRVNSGIFNDQFTKKKKKEEIRQN